MIGNNDFFNNRNIRNEIESLQKQIQNIKESIYIIEEKISKYVSETDIPSQLYKDLKSLKRKLQELESELNSKTNIIKQQPKVPKFLHYLPDRKPQETELDKLLQHCFQENNSKPLVCIVHGDRSQGHDTFLERIREVFLPTRFRPDKRSPISKYLISCPKDNISNKTNFHDQLRITLASKITNYAFNSIQEINEALSNQYTMIYIHLSVEDWYQLEIDCIGFFLEFWQTWTDLCNGQFLMVCLSIKYPTEDNLSFCKRHRLRSKKRKFINRLEQYFDSKLSQCDRIMGTILPELESIKQEDVNNWFSTEVRKLFSDDGMIEHLDRQIKSLYEKWNKKNKNYSNAIPMDYLATKLRKILQGNSVEEEDVA